MSKQLDTKRLKLIVEPS
jgi:hypothetical protein